MICAKYLSRRDPVMERHWRTFPLQRPATVFSSAWAWNLPNGDNVKFLIFGVVELKNGLFVAGRIGVAEPTVGMTPASRVEESDERPGKPLNISVFEQRGKCPPASNGVFSRDTLIRSLHWCSRTMAES